MLGAQGQVWVVDDDGGSGVDFTTLQAAIAAASDNDTLLVRSGVYGPAAAGDDVISIESKSLVIAADTNAKVVVRDDQDSSRSLLVQLVAPEQQVVLRGIDFELGQLGTSLSPLMINNFGDVRLEDCTFRSEGPMAGANLVEVNNCASVVMTRCSVEANQSSTPAVLVFASFFAAFDTSIAAGRTPDPTGGPRNGGVGLRSSDARVYLSGCRIEGGMGQEGSDLGGACAPGGDGGDGLFAISGEVVVEDCLFLPGIPGGSADPACQPGVPGELIRLEGLITLTDLDPAPPRMEASSPVREGGLLRLAFDAPDNLAFALISAEPVQTPLLPLGELLVETPTVLSFVGTVYTSGKAEFLPVAAPSPGKEADLLHIQGALLDPLTGTVRLTNSSAVTLLAAGF